MVFGTPSVLAADCDPFELLWANTTTPATEGATRELFYSQAVNQEVSYEVWLPPSYDRTNPDRRYPTVYWLHGIGGNQDSGSKFWSRMETALTDGRAPEMIIVGINGLCNKMYMNSWTGVWPVESMILDVVRDVDTRFHTHAYRAARALEGFSMGAFGTIKLGWKYPEMFALVSSFGGPLFTDVDGLVASPVIQNENIYPNLFDASEAFFNDENLQRLLAANQALIRNQHIRLAYGELDVMDANIYTPIVHSLLDELSIGHEFTLIDAARHLAAEQYDNYESLENLNLFQPYLDRWHDLPDQADTDSPAPVTNLRADPAGGGIALHWTNPVDSDFAGVRIQRTRLPQAARIDQGVAIFSGRATEFIDRDLEYGATYHYTLYAYDSGPNYSSGSTVSAKPMLNSLAEDDGYIIECPFEPDTGGEVSSVEDGNEALRIGDTWSNLRYLSILSFDTSVVPRHARIESASMHLHQGKTVGDVSGLGNLKVDMHALGFGGSATLQVNDLEAAADAVDVASLVKTADGYAAAVTPDGLEYINPLGKTQFRIRFETASDYDATEDYLGFYSGDSDEGLQPTLDLTYRLGTTITKLSIAAEDGYIIESDLYPGMGDRVMASTSDQSALRIGDTGLNTQYVSVVSFDLSDISQDMEITQAQLLLDMGEIQGSGYGMGMVTVDSNIGGFSGSPVLESADFSTYDETTDYLDAASLATDLNLSGGMIGVGGRALLNQGNPAQFRIHYQDVRSDGDDTEDYLAYWSGEADTALRPELKLVYYSGPVFEADMIVKVDATEGVEYFQSIAGKAVDPDNDQLIFLKLSGPEWLTIKPFGILSGTPAEQDVGRNVWLVRINTEDGTDVAYMQIDVLAADDPDDADDSEVEEENDDSTTDDRRGRRS
jgi:enterochelin esterase-like enzyme